MKGGDDVTTSIRVLIADPDPGSRSGYIEGLRRFGCDAIEASDGREALVEALVRRPSLIVLESKLPIVNGPALCEILRRDSMTRTVPIVALANHAAAPEVERIRRAGADAVLVKPIGTDKLIAELQRLLGGGKTAAPDVAGHASPSAGDGLRPGGKRMASSRAHQRCVTTAPPVVPPTLRCPTCDGALAYTQSYVGGVSSRHPEQWDEFNCVVCGTYEYRHRTRKLRRLA